jgi:alkylhydroperoxidase family enzyme
VTVAVLADYRTAPIDAKLRATLGFVEKLTLLPAEVSGDDLRPVLAAGVTPSGVREALYVVAMFSMITRCADAFGFGILDDAGFEASGKALLKFGYEL